MWSFDCSYGLTWRMNIEQLNTHSFTSDLNWQSLLEVLTLSDSWRLATACFVSVLSRDEPLYDAVCVTWSRSRNVAGAVACFKLRRDASQNRSRVRTQERTLYVIYWVNELHRRIEHGTWRDGSRSMEGASLVTRWVVLPQLQRWYVFEHRAARHHWHSIYSIPPAYLLL